jgi:hypothetical protein
MAIIWTAAVDHKHGTTLFAATTEDGIYAQLADYCREWWDKDGPGAVGVALPAEVDDRAIVAQYFADNSEEWFVVEDVPLADAELTISPHNTGAVV